MKVINSRQIPEKVDFAAWGEDAGNNMGHIADLLTECANLFSSTVDGNDIDLDIATIGGLLTANGGITMGDAKDIAVNTTTGTKIGTATGQKIGLWNVTPVIQPAAADQAAAVSTTTTTATTTALQTDLDDVRTLLNQIRTDLVSVGVIKGAA